MATKKAQAWGFDLFMAIIIFIGGILFFYIYTINYSNATEEPLAKLQKEAALIGDSLMSEGSPTNWDEDPSTVVRIGLLSNGKINQSKLDEFYNLNQTDYERTKSLFRIRNDYYIEFQTEVDLSGSSGTQIGYVPEEYDNLIKITRVVIYENNVTTLDVYTWN